MNYPGGKGAAGVAQTIINEQPPHDIYIEAFLGGGSVLRAKRPARRNVGIDLDPSTIAAFTDAGSGLALSGDERSTYEFRCGNAVGYLRDLECSGRELVYCDPPYLGTARKQNRRLYRYELLDESQHRELLDVLCGLRCMVQVSGYWSSLYAARLEGWRLVRYQAMTRAGLAEECLWMNYPAPLALHDYRFLGSSFRERERIKRKVNRWTARLSALPRLERLALYSSISAVIDGSGDVGRQASSDVSISARVAGNGDDGSRAAASSDAPMEAL